MTPKIHIPAIALLALQLTECKGDADAIVGDWVAVEVDGEPFPITFEEYGANQRHGYELSVEPDLSGRFGVYYTEEYEDIGQRGEYSLPIEVDGGDAPRYRIELRVPQQNSDPGSEEYAYDGEPLAPGPGLASLTARPHPRAAELVVRFDCTLGDEFLTCEQTALGDFPNDMRLARKPEET